MKKNVGLLTDAPDARECGLVEGGGPISARHKRRTLVWIDDRLLRNGASWDGVGDNKSPAFLHHALEVNVGLVTSPLP